MKKNSNFNFIPLIGALIFVLCLVLFFTDTSRMRAGFGNYNDYDSGSGYDSGGSWGGSSSWSGSDWGSDYGSSYGGYGRRSGSDAGFLRGLIAVVLSICIAFLFRGPGPSIQPSGTSGQTSRSYVVKHDKESDERYFKNRNGLIEEMIRRHDPHFSAQELVNYARNVYMEIQDAWSKRDLTPVRHLLGENLYDQSVKQVEQFKEDGIINHLRRIAILSAHACFYKKDTKDETVTIYLCAKMNDWQEEEKTGTIVRGNKDTYWEMAYRMRFTRKAGSVTAEDGKVKSYNCPNCGAVLTVGLSEKCPHCGSVVSTIRSEWVLQAFEATNSSMRDEGIEV